MGSWFCGACAGLTVSSSKRKSRQIRNGGMQPLRNICLLLSAERDPGTGYFFFVIFSVYNNSEIFGNGLGCHLSVPFI